MTASAPRHLTITLQPDWRAALRQAGQPVHEDVQTLLELGLVECTEAGGVVCPFAEVHIDTHLLAPQGVAA